MTFRIHKVECDFTLALNNRTGKYHFCKELLAETSDLVQSIRYWRLPAATPPRGLLARLLGRFAQIEVALRFRYPISYQCYPTISRNLPVVFTDPRECVLYSIRPFDIVICHDMGPLTHPDLYHPGVFTLYQRAFERIAAAKPHIVFVSEASRAEFINRFGSDFPCLRVVHIPLRQEMEADAATQVDGLSERFLLSVGAIGTRKNQLRSVEAFRSSGLADEGFDYILCGGPESGYEEVVEAAANVKGVTLIGHVSDSELRWLYHNARGFVLPSLLEGFGLPAAEAIRFNLIPIVGRGGALQEVTGDQAILVDPLSAEEIAVAMRQVIEMNENERAARLEALKRHVSQFSRARTMMAWRDTLSTSINAANIARGIYDK